MSSSSEASWIEVIVGILTGHFIGRLIWGLLLWIVSIGLRSSPGAFLFLFGVALACAAMVWGVGYVGVYAILPRSAKISAALSGMVGAYVAFVLFCYGMFGWTGWSYQNINGWPGLGL